MPATPSRVVFITGAASGIGAALARRLAGRGDRVVIADVNLAGAQALAAALGSSAQALPLDVRDAQQWQAALDAAWSAFGRVDVLVNNAGIVHAGNARDVDLEAHRQTLDVNLMGPITGMLAALPRFRAQGHGHFVTIASMTAFIPFPGLASYAAGKHALRAFHHSLAMEERDGPLRFTIFHPAAVETPMLEQEAQVGDSVALAFSEPTWAADTVAGLICEAMDRGVAEAVMPPVFGRIIRFAAGIPGLVRRILIAEEARGRKALASRKNGVRVNF